MGVVGGQEHATHPGRLQVLAYGDDQGGAETLATGGGIDVDVAEPGEGGVVGDDTGVGDLLPGNGVVRAEVERAGDGAVLLVESQWWTRAASRRPGSVDIS
jgi:hypothetical protein